ncbi:MULTISPECIES: type VI secretion system protein TssA [Cobetia]|uniref:type VI secretion system protein TssA n=1 Tax=Cobetia TaxID=204286 RepID=UPI000985DC29|nr:MULTISPECIES: type VI secretion system protein TssA [Cobetia]POR06691.1 ImpA-like protein [Cobetia sp. MM1IDA2H-1]
MADEWDRDELLAPIGAHGTGEDLGFSLLFDEIKEARRADPAYLSQGEWQADLKKSDWNAVISLTADGLAEQSKDLSLAGWLCEGLAHRDHFTGLAWGLELMTALCEQYWETLYPTLEEGDEERVARLTWLDDTLAGMIGTLPLVEGQLYGLDRYEESRQVENLARTDVDAMEGALADGKINADIFQRSVVLTETATFRERHQQIVKCQQALAGLVAQLNAQLGVSAPTFSQLQRGLADCTQLIERLLGERGVSLDDEAQASAESDVEVTDAASGDASTGDASATPSAQAGMAPAALRTTPQTREEAFDMLNGVAQYFKGSEPHSPVPYLVERAVRWGRMPLEEWLRDVIREEHVVDGIRETLGTQRRDDH